MRFYHFRPGVLALIVFSLFTSVSSASSIDKENKTGLKNLPLVAQYTISGALDRDKTAYHVRGEKEETLAEPPGQHLAARFHPGGIEVDSGLAGWGLTVSLWGYGEEMIPVEPALIKAKDNRVEYAPGPMPEWYVNGPLGLQQGFPLERGPSERHGGLRSGLANTPADDLRSVGNPVKQYDGSVPLTYVGPKGRISLGINEDGLVGDVLGILGKPNQSAWLGQLWLGESGAGGLQLDYHWLHGTPEQPGSVLKVFAAVDQNIWDDRKISGGFGWEKRDSFIDAYLMHSVTGSRRVRTATESTVTTLNGTDATGPFTQAQTVETVTRFYEHPYDYGAGVRLGRFFEPWLLRVRSGLDYERGEYDCDQWTLSGMLDKYLGKTGFSVSLQGEYLRKHGDFETDKSDARGVLLLRYEFGPAFRPLIAGKADTDSKEQPAASKAWIERALRNPSEHKRTVDFYKYEEKTTTTTLSAKTYTNQPPLAVADTAPMMSSLPFITINVLANDSDPDGDPLTIIAVSATVRAGFGSFVTIAPGGGSVDYTKDLISGPGDTDSFTYTISDGRGGTSTATVTVNITP